MKKAIYIIIVLIIIILFVGIYFIFNKNTNKENGYGIDKNNETILLKAIETNSRIEPNDIWQSTEYVIYYNGIIECKKVYSNSGIKNKTKENLSEKDFQNLNSFLQNEFINLEGATIAADGSMWDIQYFDQKGKEIHKVEGDMTDKIYKALMPIFEKYTTN